MKIREWVVTEEVSLVMGGSSPVWEKNDFTLCYSSYGWGDLRIEISHLGDPKWEVLETRGGRVTLEKVAKAIDSGVELKEEGVAAIDAADYEN